MTNTSTGKTYVIYYSIWYASPELDGGSEVAVINGKYYGSSTYDDEIFRNLIGQALMKDIQDTSNVQTTSLTEVNSQLTNEDRRTEIMLIVQYTNWAWEYQNYGYFVTIYGDVYEFDFSNDDSDEYMFPNEKTDFLANLVDIMDKGQISRFENVSDIESLLLKVDANSGLTTENTACDFGRTTLYGVRPNVDNTDMETIKLYANGDNLEVLQDDYAQKIVQKFLDSNRKTQSVPILE